MIHENKTVLEAQPLENFVNTPYIRDITHRALVYIKAGYAVHFRGPAGTGKTTLAKHVASKLGRPIVMIHGDEEFSTSSLVGGEFGYKSKKVVDNFISTVLKKEEEVVRHWVDNRLTVAVKHGFTLLYDEFTRSRPEANNILLPVLEEGLLNLPAQRGNGDPYLQAHPNFVCLFTSNPEEYAGVYRSQDALRDRMVTLDLDYFDYETEVAIAVAKSNISQQSAEVIVNVVRGLRESGKCEFSPTVRGCIIIARAMKVQQLSPFSAPEIFEVICKDVLASETSRVGSKTNQDRIKKIITELISRELQQFYPAPKLTAEAS